MEALEIDIAWGGFYLTRSEDSGDYRVFRLLDFNKDACHAAFFTETFESPPGWEEVKDLSPFVGHVPMDARSLLNYEELQLLGRTPLDRDDLSGYEYYLGEHGVDPERIDELFGRIIEFSGKEPMQLRLGLDGEELAIDVR